MNFNTYASSRQDLDACVNASKNGTPHITEVLIEPSILAREGQLSIQEALTLAEAARQRNLRPVLVWDALMPQRVLDDVLHSITVVQLKQFDAIRMSDPGVAFWVFENVPSMPIHYIVETGNHNLEALRGWQALFGSALERFVLSIELPEEKLIEYCQTLETECEVLGVGRILLFYSPRGLTAQHLEAPALDLVDAHLGETLDQDYDRENESSGVHLDGAIRPQKSLNRAFPTLETMHGTFMYLDKDQFILDRIQPLREAGLAALRIDLRHLSDEGNSATKIEQVCQRLEADPTELRKNWPRPTRAPFFKTNRTTAQFKRMKSFLHELRDERCLAEIIGGDNGKYVVYQSLRAFDVSEVAAIVLPTGEAVVVPPQTVFRNQDGRELRNCQADQIMVSGWIKKAVSGALLTTHNPGSG